MHFLFQINFDPQKFLPHIKLKRTTESVFNFCCDQEVSQGQGLSFVALNELL